jgi:hypothetical protein
LKFLCNNKNSEIRIDACKLAKIKAPIISAIVVQKIKEFASFDLVCPFKIQKYNVKNLSLELPSISFMPSGFFCIEFKLFGKSKGKKVMDKILEIKRNFQLV